MADILWTIYLGILGAALIGLLIQRKYKTIPTKIDFVISVITWIGLFGYVTETQILTQAVWKFVFFGGLAWDFVYGIFFNDYAKEEMDDIPVHLRYVFFGLSFLFFVGPLYYGLFKYAF